jgi:hypothetical protein
MSLETRIAELEAKLGLKKRITHIVMVPGSFFRDDERGIAAAKGQALADNPAPVNADPIIFIQFIKAKPRQQEA